MHTMQLHGGAVLHFPMSTLRASSLRPLLWVHGQLNDASGLFSTATRIATRRAAPWAALDLPGHGVARAMPSTDAAHLAAAIAEALKELAWTDAVVIGHSLGGWACLDAMLAGAPIAHGVLVGCPNDLSSSARAEFNGFATLLETGGFTDGIVDIALQRWYGGRTKSTGERFRDVVSAQLHRNDIASAAAVLRATAARAPTMPVLPTLRGRVHVLLGSEDVIVSDEEAAAMADAVGGAVHNIDGGSHFPFVDASEAFDAAVLAVLAHIDEG